MNSLKKFLLQHGEKLALAVIVLLCLYSITGRLGRDSRQLELPNGKLQRVDQDDIKRKIEQVEQHLGSSVRTMPSPTPEKTSLLLARMVLSGSLRPEEKAGLEWYPYVQNPPIGVPPLVSKPVIKGEVLKNVPADYRTRFGNPEDVQVIAAVDHIVVIAKDSQFLNYPEPGSRAMLLWRKAIGSGKDDLAPAVRTAIMKSPRTATVAGLADAGEATTGAAAATAATAATPAAPAAAGWINSAPTRESRREETAPVAAGAEQYKLNWQEADARAFEDLKAVCTPTSVVESGWELVTPKMYALKQEPSEEVLKQILENNITPELVEMSAEEEAAYKAKAEAAKAGAAVKEPAKPEKVATGPNWDDLMAPRVDRRSAQPAAAAAAAPAADAASPRYYVYVDRSIQQNMVYRYALIASVKPQFPPKEILDKPEHQGWEIYCEVNGISGVPPTGGDFAPPARLAKNSFVSGMTAKKKGIEGVHLNFTPCYQSGVAAAAAAAATAAPGATPAAGAAAKSGAKPATAASSSEDTGPEVKNSELRDDKGRLTPLGWAYKNQEPCFSDFVYTDLVLTPKEFEFELNSVFSSPTETQASIRVHKVEKDGTPKSTVFSVPFKPLQERSPGWQDFLAKDGSGRAIWPPKILSLQDVYSKLGEVKPVMVGGPRGKDDYTSGWGVVDMRPYEVKGKRFRKDSKSGEWKLIGDYPQRPLSYAVILAEMNPPQGQPRRFVRIFRPEPQPKNPDQKVEFEYIWEPELNKRIAEREKSSSGKPAAPAPAPGR